MSDLFGNPEDRFSRVAAHMCIVHEKIADPFFSCPSYVPFLKTKFENLVCKIYLTALIHDRMYAISAVRSFTGMGLITGMDYRNGHLYVSLGTFYLVFRTDWPRIYS